MILDQFGKEISKDNPSSNDRELNAALKSFTGVNYNFLRNLSSGGSSVNNKVKRPYSSHPWVSAASTIIARVISQSPLKVFTETQKETEKRTVRAKQRGEIFTARRGARRNAINKHSNVSVNKRLTTKALEEDFDHPLNQLFNNPSPHLDLSQIVHLTVLFQVLEGRVYWLYTYKGELCGPGDTPDRIWIVTKDCMTPIQENYRLNGELVGWEMSPPKYLPKDIASKATVYLELDDVTEFKTPDPENQLDGFGAFTASASEIENDLMLTDQDRKLLKNGGVPGGILKTDNSLGSTQTKEIREMWASLHEGERNRYRIALLHSGLSWQDVQQSSTDQRDIEKKEKNRTVQLATAGVPSSVLGITESANYATQLGQDRNFWDKTLMCYVRGMERAIDSSRLMYEEPDSTMILFDLTQVESLRAGLELKVMTAEKMAGANLHMPPSAAFEIVGIDCPDYPGKDDAFVSGTLLRATDVLEGLDLFEPDTGEEVEPTSDQVADDEETGTSSTQDPAEPNKEPSGVGDGEGSEVKRFSTKSSRTKGRRAAAIWRGFILVQNRAESSVKRKHKKWSTNWRDGVLERLDKANLRTKAYRKSDELSLEFILPDVTQLINSLGNAVRPTYLDVTEQTYEFTTEELGIPVFDIEDEAIIRFWRKREALFTKTVGRTTFKRLKRTLTDGLNNSDSHDELRDRVLDAYKREITASRARTIARTETAGLMNGVRREMFQLQGFTKGEWTTALDEKVRPDHITFGEAGPQDFTFNYLSLVGQDSEGVLRHPNDTEGTAKQVINCRCTEIAAE